MLANFGQFLHLFFAFSFVATLVLWDWNGRAARATSSWSERALLFRLIHAAGRTAGIGSLVLLGVFGHLSAVARGYRMSAEPWLWWVTGLWLATLFVMAAISLPCARRLAAVATAAAEGQVEHADTEWAASLGRWRLGNVILSVLYLALLALMVFRWRA